MNVLRFCTRSHRPPCPLKRKFKQHRFRLWIQKNQNYNYDPPSGVKHKCSLFSCFGHEIHKHRDGLTRIPMTTSFYSLHVLQNPINAILEVGAWCVYMVMFSYLKNLYQKLYINLKEPYEDAVPRNINMATPRTVETKCHQDTEPNVIHNYYKYLTLVFFQHLSQQFKRIL